MTRNSKYKEINSIIEKCGCECHEPNVMLMHCFPCCSYCEVKKLNWMYEKYVIQNFQMIQILSFMTAVVIVKNVLKIFK